MINPQPLKDKVTCFNCLNTPCNCGLNNSAFIKGDVKNTVEWLHNRLEELDNELATTDMNEVAYSWAVRGLVNKAFEDVK